MLGLSFVNFALLGGVGLASIPLIIHILNRRRYKIVHWAAMEFLLKAFKENRRRIRFEQLLLLLLRMLVVALLALILSRPRASSDELGNLLGRRVVHHVIVVDESGSMTESAGAGTSFDVLRQQVLARVEAIARSSSTDRVTLLRSSSQSVDLEARQSTLKTVSDVKELLGPARPTPDRFSLDACLERASRIARQLTTAKQADATYLHLFSDFKEADLIGDEGKLDEAVVKGLRKLDLQRIVLESCGKTEDKNVAIVDIRVKEAMLIKNLPATFEVTVQNLGAGSSAELELGLSIDGAARKVRSVPALGPKERHIESFRTTFTAAGSHFVEADLPKDRMPIDDRRAFAFPVHDNARVLLVDGDPSDSEERAETFFLKIALDPTDDASAGLDVSRVDENEIAGREFGDYAMMILANVASLDEETTERLHAYVKEGGGLLLFSGDQVEPRIWNKLLWRDGNGLLPAPLKDIGGDFDNPDRGISMKPDGHPMFTGDREVLGRSLTFVDILRYHTIGSDELREGQVPKDVDVLLRVGHESGAPLWLEKRFGNGRVAHCLTTADANWNVWASNPSYLIVARMAVDWLMRQEDYRPFNVDARTAFRKAYSAAAYHTEVRLGAATRDDEDAITERGFTMTPKPDDPEKFELDAAPVEGRVWPARGCYKLTLQTADNATESEYFSVSPWEREGEPRELGAHQFKALLPPELEAETVVVETTSSQAGLLADEGEFWRELAFLLLAFLFLESVLAWRFGRR